MSHYGSQAFINGARRFFEARVQLAATERSGPERLHKALLALESLGIGEMPVRTEWFYLRVKRIVGVCHFSADRTPGALRNAIQELSSRQVLRAIHLLRVAGDSMDQFSLVEPMMTKQQARNSEHSV